MGFDFDHTLGIDNGLERVGFLRLLEPIVQAGGAPLGTLDQEIERIDALLREQRSGAFGIDEAVERFVRERGVTATGPFPARFVRSVLAAAEAFVVAAPGLQALLAGLRGRRIPYAILSNGWAPLQQRKATCIGFDGPVLTSAEIGAQKPQRPAFEALAHRLNCAPQALWYVGDDPYADVAGAVGAGMHAIWLDALGRPYPAEIAAPDAVIHSLHEVLERVRP